MEELAVPCVDYTCPTVSLLLPIDSHPPPHCRCHHRQGLKKDSVWRFSFMLFPFCLFFFVSCVFFSICCNGFLSNRQSGCFSIFCYHFPFSPSPCLTLSCSRCLCYPPFSIPLGLFIPLPDNTAALLPSWIFSSSGCV